MLVIRELIFGPKRFSDLRQDLPGISANILTRRLADLEAAGMVQRVPLPRPARGRAYDLTDWGRDFREVIRVMGAWAARSPHLCHDWPLSPASVMLSLSSMFDPTRAAPVALELHLGQEVFAVQVENGRLSVEPGPLSEAECVVTCDQNDLLPVLYGGKPVDRARADGSLSIEGDPAALERFAGMVRLPERAPL